MFPIHDAKIRSVEMSSKNLRSVRRSDQSVRVADLTKDRWTDTEILFRDCRPLRQELVLEIGVE
jgi:hypothetical protein